MHIYSVADMMVFVGRKLNGTGVDSTCEPGLSQALEGLNAATRQLMVEERCIVDGFLMLPVSASGEITLDARIKEILEAKVMGHNSMPVVGKSAYFLDGAAYDSTGGEKCLPNRLEFQGSQHVLHQKLDKPRMLFAVSDNPLDVGLEMLVLGCDAAGQTLRTGASLGIMVPITHATCDTAPVLACDPSATARLVDGITMIRKPRTAGYVQLWGYEPETGDVFWLTTIAPPTVSPSYTKYRVRGWGSAAGHIFAHVALKYVEMVDLNDVSIIQQPDAIELMTQAIAFRDSGDINSFQAYRNMAIAYIKKDKKAEQGSDFRLNVKTGQMPLKGRSFAMRPGFR